MSILPGGWAVISAVDKKKKKKCLECQCQKQGNLLPSQLFPVVVGSSINTGTWYQCRRIGESHSGDNGDVVVCGTSNVYHSHVQAWPRVQVLW